MSHYSIETFAYKDVRLLKQALLDCGVPENQIMQSFNGNGLRLVDYMGDQTQLRAHLLVKRNWVGRSCNDLGFEFTESGCTIHICDYARKARPDFLAEVRQKYILAETLEEYQNAGQQVESEVDPETGDLIIRAFA